MAKYLLLVICITAVFFNRTYSQKKYGYAVIYLRCDKNDPARNRIYYSPIVELNTLNFKKYAYNVDPSFPLYSVNYYNYAISQWFEMYLQKKFKIEVTDPEKYEQDAYAVVLDESNGNCDAAKTGVGCFFTDKQKITRHRNNKIAERKLAKHATEFCEVIAL